MPQAAPVIAVVGLAASAIGAGVSAYSSYQQGKAQESMAKYNAAMSEYNAKVAERSAQAQRTQADYQVNQQRERVRRINASQRTLYAKAGVSEFGSPLEVMEETAAQGELDAQAIRYQGGIASQQYLSQASMDRMQAWLDRMKGKSYASAGAWGAGTSLLTGLGNTAFSAANYKW